MKWQNCSVISCGLYLWPKIALLYWHQSHSISSQQSYCSVLPSSQAREERAAMLSSRWTVTTFVKHEWDETWKCKGKRHPHQTQIDTHTQLLWHTGRDFHPLDTSQEHLLSPGHSPHALLKRQQSLLRCLVTGHADPKRKPGSLSPAATSPCVHWCFTAPGATCSSPACRHGQHNGLQGFGLPTTPQREDSSSQALCGWTLSQPCSPATRPCTAQKPQPAPSGRHAAPCRPPYLGGAHAVELSTVQRPENNPRRGARQQTLPAGPSTGVTKHLHHLCHRFPTLRSPPWFALQAKSSSCGLVGPQQRAQGYAGMSWLLIERQPPSPSPQQHLQGGLGAQQPTTCCHCSCLRHLSLITCVR